MIKITTRMISKRRAIFELVKIFYLLKKRQNYYANFWIINGFECFASV